MDFFALMAKRKMKELIDTRLRTAKNMGVCEHRESMLLETPALLSSQGSLSFRSERGGEGGRDRVVVTVSGNESRDWVWSFRRGQNVICGANCTDLLGDTGLRSRPQQ